MRSPGFASLVGILVMVVIIGALVYVYFPSATEKKDGTQSFKLLDDAKGVKASLEARDAEIQGEMY
jgi:hypothetical protein